MVHWGAKRKVGIYKSHCSRMTFPGEIQNKLLRLSKSNTDRTNLLLGALMTHPPKKNTVFLRLELQTFNCEWLDVVVCNRSNVCWRFCLNHSDAQNHICGVIAHVINSYTPSWNEAWNQYLMQNFILFPLEPQWISSQMPTRLWKIFESQPVMLPSPEEILTQACISFLGKVYGVKVRLRDLVWNLNQSHPV